MENTDLLAQLFKLSTEDRIHLAGALWDSVGTEQDQALPLPPSQKDELARRAAAHAENPAAALPWDAIRARLRPG